MKNLTTAIYSQMAGSAFGTSINSRLYKGQAPDGTSYPYSCYFVVTNTPERTFTEDYRNVIVQFSLFSSESGSTEIENMAAALEALYDEQPMTVTGSTLIWMKLTSTTGANKEDHITPSGTQSVWVVHSDYEIMTSLD